MFADLEKLAPDPILGVTIAFRADPIAAQGRSRRRRLPRRTRARRPFRRRCARRNGQCSSGADEQDLRRARSATPNSTSGSRSWRSGRWRRALRERIGDDPDGGRLRRAAPWRRDTHVPQPGAGGPRQHADLGESRTAARQLRARTAALPVLRRCGTPASSSSACSTHSAASRPATSCCCTAAVTTRPVPTWRLTNGSRSPSCCSGGRSCRSWIWRTRGWATISSATPRGCGSSPSACPKCCSRSRARRTSVSIASASAR